MNEEIKEEYVKRTQKNYPMALKLSVVQEKWNRGFSASAVLPGNTASKAATP